MRLELRPALTFAAVCALLGGITYGLDEWRDSRNAQVVTSGTVMGFRFSGDYVHQCRLLIRPDGTPRATRPVPIDPNDTGECLSLDVLDHWERQP